MARHERRCRQVIVIANGAKNAAVSRLSANNLHRVRRDFESVRYFPERASRNGESPGVKRRRQPLVPIRCRTSEDRRCLGRGPVLPGQPRLMPDSLSWRDLELSRWPQPSEESKPRPVPEMRRKFQRPFGAESLMMGSGGRRHRLISKTLPVSKMYGSQFQQML